MEYFLATGNLKTTTGLDQMQSAGFVIVADKLNILRYISHFRCVHRGAYFAEMKTTAVRKLLPEAWGFICPVHTPDGAPCGLLNHLTRHCTPQTKPEDARETAYVLCCTALPCCYACMHVSVCVCVDVNECVHLAWVTGVALYLS